MIRSTFVGLSILASSAGAFQTPVLQWTNNTVNGLWYGAPFGTSTWSAGQTTAQTQGGNLATIRNSAENLWISQNFGSVNSNGLWIGLNDLATEGQYVWASGETPGYTNWGAGEPNNTGNQDVVRIYPGNSWRWDDISAMDSTLTALVELAPTPRVGWTLPRATAVQTLPSHLAAADFNADGRMDVVVPNQGSSSFSVLLGDGNGGFASAGNFATAASPVSAEIRDFDGDGDLDIALACGVSTRLRVHFNDGVGGFGTFFERVHTGRGAGLAAADFDGDGLVDLAETTTDTQDRLWIHRNVGGGTFAAPVAYATGQTPYFVSAGDLDGDLDVDLIVSNFASDDLSIFRNQGDGTFTSSALVPRGDGPMRVAIADFTGDGLADLAIPCRLDASVRLYFNLGGAQFIQANTLPTLAEPYYAALGDFDGDPYVDVAVSYISSDAVGIYRGRSDGYMDPPYPLRADDGPTGIVVGDTDGDGRDDLVVAAYNAARVVVLRKISRDCNGNGVDDPVDIQLATSADCNGNGEPDECDLALGATFDCDANGAVDSCEIVASPGLDLDADGTLDECEVAGTSFCFGDGTGATCPCDPGQAGDPGSGCKNSVGRSGRLEAVGNPSVANDSVSLRASGLLNTTVGLFFQGNSQQNAGAGSSFGDGLLCVNQAVVRMEIRFATNASMAFGQDVPGDPSVAADGLVPAAGATRYYQVWYRDPAMFCTTSTFNLTNGVRIVWTP